MRTNHARHIISACLAIGHLMLTSLASEAPVATDRSEQARIYIIDDSTGEELAKEHQIKPVEMDDMLALVGTVVAVQKTVQIQHELIDEDATDNKVRNLLLTPFTGSPVPTKPDPKLPLTELKKAKVEYRKKVALFSGDIRAYRSKLEADAEAFVKSVASAQDELTDRFARQLEKNHGRDYKRSDVYGSLDNANRALGKEGLRALVMNTDGRNETNARKAPSPPIALDPGIIIVWVSGSGKAQQQEPYRDLPNKCLSAKSMLEAMQLIKTLLSPSGQSTEDDKDKGMGGENQPPAE